MAERLLQFFKADDLDGPAKNLSEHFHALAVRLTQSLPLNAERTTALRKLLEARDAALRSRVSKD